MILRKPYAFLIKHFKLLHLILLGLVIFVILETKEINDFFVNYVDNNYSTNITGDLSSIFVPILLIIAIILLLLILIITVYLLIHKNKKQKIYTITIGYYIATLVILIYFISIFNTLETGIIESESARIYRDLSLLIYYPQMIIIPFFLIRGLGFNVKQFNFKNDLKELELNTIDNEEVEINVEFDTFKTKRNIRRYFREFKYYVKENLVMLIITSVLAIIFIVFSVFDSVVTYSDTVYQEKQNFYYNNATVNVNQSFITNVDYKGEQLPNDNYFLVVQVILTNEHNYNIELNTDDFKLVYDGKSINPSISYSDNFIDYGIGLNSNTIKAGSSKTYVIPYIISENEINNDYSMKIYSHTVNTESHNYSISNIINLNTYSLSKLLTVETVKMSNQLSFNNSNLGESFFTINSFEIANPYYYDYSICNGEDCKIYKDIITSNKNNANSSTLLILDVNLILDKSTQYGLQNPSLDSFMNTFSKIEYIVNGKTYTETVDSIVKSNLENKVAINVDKSIENASNINLIFTIRNKQYIYIIKN